MQANSKEQMEESTQAEITPTDWGQADAQIAGNFKYRDGSPLRGGWTSGNGRGYHNDRDLDFAMEPIVLALCDSLDKDEIAINADNGLEVGGYIRPLLWDIEVYIRDGDRSTMSQTERLMCSLGLSIVNQYKKDDPNSTRYDAIPNPVKAIAILLLATDYELPLPKAKHYEAAGLTPFLEAEAQAASGFKGTINEHSVDDFKVVPEIMTTKMASTWTEYLAKYEEKETN
jgi:hypothetical protein